MGRMKEYYHDVINQIDDVDDSEYFQWLTEKEWEESITKEELLSYNDLTKENEDGNTSI